MDWKRTCELIPDGVSTMSKMPCRHVQGVYPIWADGGYGAELLVDSAGYLDYEMGLGAVILGHAHPRIVETTCRQAQRGGAISAPSRMEGELAAKICELVPSAQKVRFTTTGTEACMAAIKIARAATGRERVLCCGYHGWGSWYSAQSPHNKGCTEAEKDQIRSFTYNDIDSLKALLEMSAGEGKPVAAVILEPYVFDEPKNGYLHYVRQLCSTYGAVLIFDEVVTGFRTLGWTAQKMFGVTPDLTCLGKCMANGMVPISCVCGRADLMDQVKEENGCFVSGTFAANPLALALALATIEVLWQTNGIEQIWERGRQFKAVFEQLVSAKSLQGVSVKGYPCRTWFDFPTEAHKSLFWQSCLQRGVWFGYAQFLSYAHDATVLARTESAMKWGLDQVKTYYDAPERALHGKPAQATFRMTVHDAVKQIATAPAPRWTCAKGCPGFDKPWYPASGKFAKVPHCPTCHGRIVKEAKKGAAA